MKEPFTVMYEGYLLKCAPFETPDGRFLAHLVVSYAASGAHHDLPLTPDFPSFPTAREAADCSLAEGKRWVEQNK